MPYRRHLFVLILLSLFPAIPSTTYAKSPDTVRQLPPVYRHWLEEEVPYILSTDERKEFLALHSDLERDRFIDAFWASRNPIPGSPFNTFKEEHYRRLTYASERFGSRRYQDGWRTDMGRIYITLGPPKAIQPYHLTANIRDLELWFYQGTSPALPAFFNVLFFRPGAGEDYKLYSPRNDGPYRLVSTGQQDNKSAMHVLRQELGGEVAHAALSLYPSEPVDYDSLQPSMDSDLLLTTIRNLADNPLEKERFTRSRSREAASGSVIVPGPARQLETTIYRDERGRQTLSYLLRSRNPDASLIGKRKDGNLGWSLTLRTSLFTPAGKLIYEQQSPLDGLLTEAQAAAAKTKSFGAEDRLPVIPGTYSIEISLRNNLTAEATLYRDKLVIPGTADAALTVSALQVYGQPSPVRDPSHALPFTVAGLRFAPRSIGSATIHAGEKLPIVFQLHLPSTGETSPRPSSLHVHYVCGAVSTSGQTPLENDEDVSTDSADAAGNILTGHTLETVDLLPGSYRVVVHAIGRAGTASASASLQLRVLPAETPFGLWTAYGPEPPEAVQQDDTKRGLAAEAMENWDAAATWYASSLHDFPQDSRSLRRLALALTHLQRDKQLARLADQPQLTSAADPQTVLLVANALSTTGAIPRAIALLDKQVSLQPPSPALLDGLADLYDRSGDPNRGKQLRERARQVAPASPN